MSKPKPDPNLHPNVRCPEKHEDFQCVGYRGHSHPHYARILGNSGIRWGLWDVGCLVGIEQGYVCTLKPGHSGNHRDKYQHIEYAYDPEEVPA